MQPQCPGPAGAAVQDLRRQAPFVAVLIVFSYLGHKYYSLWGGRHRDWVDGSAYDVPVEPKG